MINWWNMQPEWLKCLRLFFGLVWRKFYDERLTIREAWAVAFAFYNRGKR